MDENLEKKLQALPGEPGVYLMKDKTGAIIYVGKAKNLRHRVTAYFAGSDDERALLPFLVQEIADFETVVVENEKEAFILENELIKRHKPRFNIKLKEGGTFVYLRLDTEAAYPCLEVTRQVKKDGARYFGPYPAAHALRETLRVMNRHFRLRTCSDHDPDSHQRPCLLCQISSFPEPSVYDIPRAEYARRLEEAILFLQGKNPELLKTLQERMEKAAEELNFEEAARLRDQIGAVRRTLEPQKVTSEEDIDMDVAGHYQEGDGQAVYLLFVRQGRVMGGRSFSFEKEEFPERNLLPSFINLYYNRGHFIPDEILLPREIEGREGLAQMLSEKKGAQVRIVLPESEDKRGLLKMSERNARQSLHQPRRGRQRIPSVLVNLQKLLGLKNVPRRMECFDVSHFQGDSIVASKVAMTDGEPDKSRYRRFGIQSVQVGDDYAAMHEAVLRQLKHSLEENDLPDLIVLDGGKGQLAAAGQALKELDITGVDTVALAKDRDRPAGEALERIYVPDRKDAVVLPPSSEEMLLLVRLRDEAHRFAITYQKKVRQRKAMASALEEIPGVGPKRQRALLRRFGSVKGLAEASIDDIAQIAGTGRKRAEKILSFLKKMNS